MKKNRKNPNRGTTMPETPFAALSLSELADQLQIPADTLILMHRNPDGDAVGSAFALRDLLTALGSRAWCLCESEIPARLRFLSDPTQPSVTPDSVPFAIDSARVVTVDIASPAQLGGLEQAFAARTDLMIDHHASGTRFASGYVNGSAAAAGEILFDLCRCFEARGRYRMNESVCTLLYAAIVSDTGCFRYSNVTRGTHLRAADLCESGIDCAEINHKLFDCKSRTLLRAEALGAERLQCFHNGKVAVIALSYAERVAAGLEQADTETLVDVARSLAGVEVALAIRQSSEEPIYRVSARSSGAFDVSRLCAKFGGGGHVKAAGCAITAPSIDDAVKQLIDAIDFSNQS